jgi:adenine deaminase
MGVKREYEAFMSLAFLSLAVIPELKLLDTGLFDVTKFAFTDINE